MGIISESPSFKNEDKRSSAPQNTSVGGGSRPTKSKIMTPTSAPKDQHELGRAPKEWLK
jgi:hypothetical protein